MIYNLDVKLLITVDEKAQTITVNSRIFPSKRAAKMPLWFLAAALTKTTRDIEKTLHTKMGITGQNVSLSKADLMASRNITVDDLLNMIKGKVVGV